MIQSVVRAWRAVFTGGRKPPQPPAKPRVAAKREVAGDEAATILEAIAEAKKEAGFPVNPAPAKTAPARATRKRPPPMTPERKRLIQDAIAIHRSKVQVLDGLSVEAREKLAVLALHLLAPDVAGKALRDPKRGRLDG